MKILIFLLVSISCNLHAEDLLKEVTERMGYIREHNDRSHFFISAASKDQPINDRRTKIHFIVTDSLGRKTGFESFFITKRGSQLVNAYREIPNSSYGVDQIGSVDPSVVPDEPESATLDFFPPILKDTYTITLIGLGNVRYFADMHLTDTSGETHDILNEGYISSGTIKRYSIHLDPTPGAGAPVTAMVITFEALRSDVSVARQLNQLGDDKFADSLAKNLNLAEKLSAVCDKRKAKKENCEPVIAVLKLFIKRLELANRKCDNPADCGEEREWDVFRNKYGMDADFKDFFRGWDKDDWHKHKKTCKRLVTDEALKIITEDTQWLIKSLSGEIN